MTATYTNRRFAIKNVYYRTELVTPNGGKVLNLGEHTPADLADLRAQFPFDGFEVRMNRITWTTDDCTVEPVEL